MRPLYVSPGFHDCTKRELSWHFHVDGPVISEDSDIIF